MKKKCYYSNPSPNPLKKKSLGATINIYAFKFLCSFYENYNTILSTY